MEYLGLPKETHQEKYFLEKLIGTLNKKLNR